MTAPKTRWKSAALAAQAQAIEDKINAIIANQPKVVRVALAALDTAGGVLAWANPESVSIIITGIYLNTTVVATAACTIDVGTTAVSAATSSDTLIDGLDVNAAIGQFSNIKNPGTNGKSDQLLASGKWVTISKASGAAAGLAGYAYIEYIKIDAPASVAVLDLSAV